MYKLLFLVILSILLLVLTLNKEYLMGTVFYIVPKRENKIKNTRLILMINKVNRIILEEVKKLSIRESNLILGKIEDIIYRQITGIKDINSKEIINKIELLLFEYIKDKNTKDRKRLLKNIEDIIFSEKIRKELQTDYDKSSLNNSAILRNTKYDPVTKKFSIIRESISEEKFRKEANRDFNYEVNLFYKTPFQFLDYQDMLLGAKDEVIKLAPEYSGSN